MGSFPLHLEPTLGGMVEEWLTRKWRGSEKRGFEEGQGLVIWGVLSFEGNGGRKLQKDEIGDVEDEQRPKKGVEEGRKRGRGDIGLNKGEITI